MRNLLYILALILIVAWSIGYFVGNAGPLIHLLLVIAIISICLQAISNAPTMPDDFE